jgi:hypothetical protein
MEHKKKVAVIIPIYKIDFSEEDNLSLCHLKQHLSGYDYYIICPENLNIELPGFSTERFNPRFFDSVSSYSRLLLSSSFYRRFLAYQYILIYQLDCLVFSNQLSDWCDMGFDYIGAPWLKTPKLGWNYSGPVRCGNGGFSLRKVDSFIKVIDRSNRFVFYSMCALREIYISRSIWTLSQYFQQPDFKSAKGYSKNEDLFWSFEADFYFPQFKTAPCDIGIRFAFDADPAHAFQKNGESLPFGCHGWYKHDKLFWDKFLLNPHSHKPLNDIHVNKRS